MIVYLLRAILIGRLHLLDSLSPALDATRIVVVIKTALLVVVLLIAVKSLKIVVIISSRRACVQRVIRLLVVNV